MLYPTLLSYPCFDEVFIAYGYIGKHGYTAPCSLRLTGRLVVEWPIARVKFYSYLYTRLILILWERFERGWKLRAGTFHNLDSVAFVVVLFLKLFGGRGGCIVLLSLGR